MDQKDFLRVQDHYIKKRDRGSLDLLIKEIRKQALLSVSNYQRDKKVYLSPERVEDILQDVCLYFVQSYLKPGWKIRTSPVSAVYWVVRKFLYQNSCHAHRQQRFEDSIGDYNEYVYYNDETEEDLE
jgi:hypothetical protein